MLPGVYPIDVFGVDRGYLSIRESGLLANGNVFVVLRQRILQERGKICKTDL